MERGEFIREDQAGNASDAPSLPAWLRRATRQSPDRRSSMLADIAQRHFIRQREAAAPSVPAEPSQKGLRHFVAELWLYLVFFSLIGALFSSRFPICLGAVLFFADGELVEWTLQRVGIRFAPDMPGPEFVKCFVFMIAWGMLLQDWRDAAPAWLLPWIPQQASWSFMAGVALLVAAVAAVSTAVTRQLLPRVGVAIAPDSLSRTLAEGVVFVSLLGLLALLDHSTSMVTGWLGGH